MPNLDKSQEQVAVRALARSWFHAYVVLRQWLREAKEPLMFIQNVEWIVRQIGLELVEAQFLSPDELQRIEEGDAEAGGFGSKRQG